MNTHEIDGNPVHAGSSPADKALEVKPPRMEIPSPDGSGDTTGKNHHVPAPVKEPSLVVVPSPNPPPGGGPG
jgi:hypothetical protein